MAPVMSPCATTVTVPEEPVPEPPEEPPPQPPTRTAKTIAPQKPSPPNFIFMQKLFSLIQNKTTPTFYLLRPHRFASFEPSHAKIFLHPAARLRIPVRS